MSTYVTSSITIGLVIRYHSLTQKQSWYTIPGGRRKYGPGRILKKAIFLNFSYVGYSENGASFTCYVTRPEAGSSIPSYTIYSVLVYVVDLSSASLYTVVRIPLVLPKLQVKVSARVVSLPYHRPDRFRPRMLLFRIPAGA